MTDLLVDISEYLISKGVATESGIDIFQDYTPETPDRIVVVSEYAGLPISPVADCSIRSIQIKCRALENTDAKQLCWSAFNSLFQPDETDLVIGQGRFVKLHPRNTPFKMGRDDEARHLWVFNLGVTTYIQQ